MMCRTTFVLGTALALAGSGCEGEAPDGPFDPRGQDGSLAVDWTIGGLAADRPRCQAAGFSHVEITVYAADDADFEDGVVVASAPCIRGRHDDETAILAEGHYRVSIDGVDEHGEVLDHQRTDSIVEVRRGAHVLAPVDFPLLNALAIALHWGGPGGACADAGVDGYSYVLRDSLGYALEDEIGVPCEEQLVVEDLPPDAYTIEVEALDVTGAPRLRAACGELSIAEGERVDHVCVVADAAVEGGGT